jgi:type 1 glutamine amidotransferase
MRNVLIHTKCGDGYVHDNIQHSVDMLLDLLKDSNVIVNNNTDIFNSDISNFNLIIFPNTNNDAFDNDEQRQRFKSWFQSGGKVLGIHSFVGTERNWEWFKKLKGCSFLWHAEIQTTKNLIQRPNLMPNIPQEWLVEDECYFGEDYFDNVEVLAYHDLTVLDDSEIEEIVKHAGKWFPIYPSTWYQNYDGGHVWVTSLGHNIETYSNELFRTHIKNGIDLLNAK